ncbi:hypothetical protein DYB28_016186, partial [Aphanomyces astaci]
VKALNQNGQYADKMKYYLTKADTVTDSKEMMKLMVQITQNIKANIQNQHGLEIPSIWITKSRPTNSQFCTWTCQMYPLQKPALFTFALYLL